ncbi:hypothetical protein BpHYR1_042867 [Brachionus plicatilis]|uniref:Uncharacterized protein n=1 Tax=Brachionus plicatilis TaxID=10195 RepID=A0A3M7PUN9_BRAPC|nr:hypothetical protein BpHYR1_042867 [Brachionus plicatilis]
MRNRRPRLSFFGKFWINFDATIFSDKRVKHSQFKFNIKKKERERVLRRKNTLLNLRLRRISGLNGQV